MPTSAAVPYSTVRRVPITAVLERYGLLAELKRIGQSFTGRCPIHKGSNCKQFVVDPARNLWRCFSPHHDAGGGVLEFVAEIENITTREAATLIARWFAIAPFEHHSERRKRMAGERPSHKAFVVEDRGEGEDTGFWTRIGSAWPHKDAKGLNIVLSALPTNGRIVLREYTDEDAAEDDKKAATNKSKRK
jgi:hypothetical protein